MICVLEQIQAFAANCGKQVYVSTIPEEPRFARRYGTCRIFLICDLDLETTSMSESKEMGSAMVFDG